MFTQKLSRVDSTQKENSSQFIRTQNSDEEEKKSDDSVETDEKK